MRGLSPTSYPPLTVGGHDARMRSRSTWSSHRSLRGLLVALLTLAAAATTVDLVRAGGEAPARVSVIELDRGPVTTATPSATPGTVLPSAEASDRPPTSSTAASPAPPPSPPPPATEEAAPVRTGDPARVVPPAPVPAGPRDDDDADDADVFEDDGDDDPEGDDGGDD